MSYTADNDVEQIVDQLIVELLPLGDCSLESVAKRLCCHPRTLQNRLAARNLEFREMLARQRFRLAQAYLTTTSTQLVEVAARLGYADQASFTRAFTGWCGQSPRRFRMTGKVRVLQN
jgi:AraC-like DNA-binding protein